MTDTTTTETDTSDAAEVPTDTTEQQPDPKPDREAARYRRQLRETETALAAANERLEALQRREVERMAGGDLSTPADFWLAGPELADLLNDDGDVDEAKVREAVATVLEGRPGWKRPDPPPSFDGGVRKSAPARQVTMMDLLQGRGSR